MTISIKAKLADFTQRAYTELELAQNELIEQIKGRGLSGSFGETHIETLKNSEALIGVVSNFGMTTDFSATEEFSDMTEDEARSWIVEIMSSIEQRERNMLAGGIKTRDGYEFIAISQYRIFLNKLLK
jgi:hypothetical protein